MGLRPLEIFLLWLAGWLAGWLADWFALTASLRAIKPEILRSHISSVNDQMTEQDPI